MVNALPPVPPWTTLRTAGPNEDSNLRTLRFLDGERTLLLRQLLVVADRYFDDVFTGAVLLFHSTYCAIRVSFWRHCAPSFPLPFLPTAHAPSRGDTGLFCRQLISLRSTHRRAISMPTCFCRGILVIACLLRYPAGSGSSGSVACRTPFFILAQQTPTLTHHLVYCAYIACSVPPSYGH